MKDWEEYIKKKVNSDVWGGIALDYYHHLKDSNEDKTPASYIDWIINNVFTKESDILSFHRVFLGICVRLLGSDFTRICKKTIKLLKIANDKVDESILKQIVIQFETYGMAETFQQALKEDTDLAKKLLDAGDDTLDIVTGKELKTEEKGKEQIGIPNSVDVAIITVLDIEYEAILKTLGEHVHYPGSNQRPNLFAWEYGEIKHSASDSVYTVIVALVGSKGSNSAQHVTLRTVEYWKPRYVVLTGIAGGFVRNELNLGDVVVSNYIVGYEYGELGKTFKPRPDLNFPVDAPLLTAATSLSINSPEWAQEITKAAPEKDISPKMVPGLVASGDKVVENPDNEFFAQVLDVWPRIQAVEMEGTGAAFSIQKLREENINTGFIMVRGISDMLRVEENNQRKNSDSNQNSERNTWKSFASASAACFTVKLIREAWPIPPK